MKTTYYVVRTKNPNKGGKYSYLHTNQSKYGTSIALSNKFDIEKDIEYLDKATSMEEAQRMAFNYLRGQSKLGIKDLVIKKVEVECNASDDEYDLGPDSIRLYEYQFQYSCNIEGKQPYQLTSKDITRELVAKALESCGYFKNKTIKSFDYSIESKGFSLNTVWDANLKKHIEAEVERFVVEVTNIIY